MQGSARGTALIVLIAALLSIAGMATARRGQIAGLMVWLGAVAYLLYNSVLFLFATPYNRLFLLDVAFLALAVFTLIRLFMICRTHSVSESPRVRHWVAGYVWAVVVLNSVAWLSNILPSVLSDRPESIIDGLGVATNPVYVQDLGFWLPAAAVIGWWLWFGRSLGNRAGRRSAELLGARVGFHRRRSGPRCRRGPVIAGGVDGSHSRFHRARGRTGLVLVLHVRAVQMSTARASYG